MKEILIQIMQDSTKALPDKSKSDLANNYWFWIATAELAFIVILLFKLRQKNRYDLELKENEIFQTSKETNIDMNNLMDSIYKSRDLYKRLSAKCHPDRFTEVDLNNKADKLFQEITRNQRNYKKLLEIKEIAQSELNITI